MLTATVTSLDGLSDDAKALYVKDGNGFRLNVEGLVDKAKLDEFRDNNTQLKAELDKLKEEASKFKDIDPTKYKELMDKLVGDEEKKLLRDGNIDAVVKMRTDKMIRDFEEQIKAKDAAITGAKKAEEAARKERDTYIVESELRKAVDTSDMGFQPNIAEVLRYQVMNEFTYRDGKVIRVKPDGTPMFGKDGNPATITEFLQDLVKDRPYLVKASSGGGAHNQNQNNGGNDGRKTMKRADFERASPDQRMKLSKERVQLVD